MLPKEGPITPVGRMKRRAALERNLLDSARFVGYPHLCYGEDPFAPDRRACRLYPGEHCFFAVTDQERGFTAEQLNRMAGVTLGQEEAMLAGMRLGWESPRANPMAYNAAGEYLGEEG